jgi:hypothetical protein
MSSSSTIKNPKINSPEIDMSKQEGYDYIKYLQEKYSVKDFSQLKYYDQVPYLV